MKKLALPKSYGKPMENTTPMQSPKLGYGKPHGKPQIKTLWKALWKAQKNAPRHYFKTSYISCRYFRPSHSPSHSFLILVFPQSFPQPNFVLYTAA